MDINRIKPYLFLLLLFPLLGCPWKNNCLDDVAGSEVVDGLMVLSPLQDTFKIGDVVIFEVIIPDSFYFGESKISLISETNDLNPSIIIPQRLGFVNFFNNDLFIIQGEQEKDKNKFRLNYCFEDNLYKLLLRTTFSISGKYWFSASNNIDYGSKSKCNFYRITTNLKGAENGKWLEFVVVE